jgi:hypothetical protein
MQRATNHQFLLEYIFWCCTSDYLPLNINIVVLPSVDPYVRWLTISPQGYQRSSSQCFDTYMFGILCVTQFQVS